jgi:hypothetical protein
MDPSILWRGLRCAGRLIHSEMSTFGKRSRVTVGFCPNPFLQIERRDSTTSRSGHIESKEAGVAVGAGMFKAKVSERVALNAEVRK